MLQDYLQESINNVTIKGYNSINTAISDFEHYLKTFASEGFSCVVIFNINLFEDNLKEAFIDTKTYCNKDYYSFFYDTYIGERKEFYAPYAKCKDVSSAFKALEATFTTFSSRNDYPLKKDVTLKQRLLDATKKNLELFVENENVKRFAKTATYTVYTINWSNTATRMIEIAIDTPSALDAAKEVTQDAEDDISNW